MAKLTFGKSLTAHILPEIHSFVKLRFNGIKYWSKQQKLFTSDSQLFISKDLGIVTTYINCMTLRHTFLKVILKLAQSKSFC